jgi:class 3 adenylate cyclase/predicted ATPase
MPRITISYRRDDSLDITGRIFDRLAGHFSREAVFRDIDNIPPGVDFRRHIDRVLDESDIVLAIVGSRWIGPDNEQRRLTSAADPVRLEIETALRKDKPLIPVLVSGAVMPHPEILPDSLHDFAYRNAIRVDSGQDFDVHVGRLIRAMERILRIDQERAATAGTADVLAPPSKAGVGAERRQLTAMFCDLVGSTALSRQTDPEDLSALIGAYHRAITERVTRFGGYVAKYMGDGVLAYFGYPEAHEDDAALAIQAGLAILDAVPGFAANAAAAAQPQVRIGVATGLVVVGELIGEGTAQERSIVGETPNLAARLQTLADPGTLVIAETTHRLASGLFEYRDLGAVNVRGFAEPVLVWEVLRPSAVESRFEALRGSALSPLIGREEELDLLLRRWRRAMTGEGQVVLLSGEPGIGKSRLTAALHERLEGGPHTRLRYFCSPHDQDSALHPFIAQLEHTAGFAHDDTPEQRLDKLTALITPNARDRDEVTLIADLLSLPSGAADVNLSPHRKREKLLAALLHQFGALARHQPVLMVVEDLHWIDPSSRELLDLTVERATSLPVLLILTFRPDFQPPWTGQPRVTMLTLNRLDRRDGTALIEQIAGSKALPDEVVAQIVDRGDGVPLFVEELTKDVLESGLLREEADRYVLDGALPPLAIPTTLHASLTARLDRLASVRLVAQIGAAIGREFPYELLRAVSRLPEKELQTSLASLVASKLVFQRGTPPYAVYSFKHALVQDAAHGSLLRGSRQQLHAQIAEALAAQSPELMESQPELFAQHYAEAGLVEKSVACWGKAGLRSVARSAMAEAAVQFHKGLDQVALLPDDRKRQQQELEFCIALGATLIATKGYAAPETGQAYARARELWDQLGSPLEFILVPYLQARYHAHCGELDMAHHLDEDLLRLGRQRNDSAGLVVGHWSCGRTLLCIGRPVAARLFLEQALALSDPSSHGSLVHQTGIYTNPSSHAQLGIALFCLGYPDHALEHSKTAIAEARGLAHPPSLALSLAFGSRLLSLHRDNAALEARASQLMAVATEQGFPFYRAQATIYSGWAKVRNGDVARGISLLRDGSAAYRATGAELWMPHYIALLARACEIAGRFEEGVTLLDDALQIANRTGERWFAAELNRHKGQRLVRQGHFEAVEEVYREALSIAREQEAKLWELRAAASLARLWRDQGRHAEARDLLAPVYGWFTEGFGTADLKEAKTLLETLNV